MAWTNAELAMLETELSPAVLQHSSARTVSLFAPAAVSDMPAPNYICFSTEQGPKIFRHGDTIDPKRMRESWFVIWWGGTNWTNWDAPFFLTLQHRPSAIQFTTNGLQLSFSGAAGFAALMPLYGYDKSMPEGEQKHPFVESRDKKKRVLTWEWHKALPADPLSRARYWASALREFPIACDESFSVDRRHDALTVRSSFRWLSWNDDWNTKHLKLAPVSPVLGLAIHEKFPAEFSKQPFDMEIATTFGPFYGVQEVDAYEATLPVLRFVHEMAELGGTNSVRALSYEAWQQAHSSGNWDAARQHWPTVRDEFVKSAPHTWAAFAGTGSLSLHQAVNALGTARLAYRLGDAETYALACHRFARALTQLVAQQRGTEYFRTHQPWHSPEAIASDLRLSFVTDEGWQFAQSNVVAAAAGSPDIARLVSAALPPRKDAPPSSSQRERLIPGGAATEFIPIPPQQAGDDAFGLVLRMKATPAGVSFHWPMWKGADGNGWNFGAITAPPGDAPQVVPLNARTRVHVYPSRR